MSVCPHIELALAPIQPVVPAFGSFWSSRKAHPTSLVTAAALPRMPDGLGPGTGLPF